MEKLKRSSIKNDRCKITSLSNVSFESKWMDIYLEINMHLNFGNLDEQCLNDIHHKIFYDLHNDMLKDEIKLHLLTLLESASQLLTYENEIVQTIGSLLNIIKYNEKDSLFTSTMLKDKLLITTTMHILEHYEWKYKSDSIKQLYLDVIRTLIDQSRLKRNTVAIECLNEIASFNGGLFEDELLEKVKHFSDELYLANFIKGNLNLIELREFIQNINFRSNLKFYHLANKVFHVSTIAPEQMSLIILKPFIIKFIMSHEVHNIHFVFKLLIKYGFEIISSFEEEVFLKQLVILSTLSTLTIGARLLYLSYVKLCFINIFKPPLNSPPLNLLNSLYPFLFDGPDTQEKKLLILNDFSFVINDEDYFKMLLHIYELCSNENKSMHTTNSFFRILHATIMQRSNLVPKILNLLLDSIFNLSYKHFIPKLLIFLESHWDFAQTLIDKFIAHLMIVLKEKESSNVDCNRIYNSIVQSYSQYISFLQLINWFLSIAHYNILLTEFQLEFLINFICGNSNHWPQSSNNALTCCTSILYYQRVTPKVKQALMHLLEWLRNERKSDLETSSLAQIYLLALQTLEESYIKQVFTSDEEEFLINRIPEHFENYLNKMVRIDQCDCPIDIHPAVNDEPIICTTLPDRLSLNLYFDVHMHQSNIFDRLFCVDIQFTSPQFEQLNQTFDIPVMERDNDRLNHAAIKLDINFKINTPFQLNISIKFIDAKGSIYHYYFKHHQSILLEDFFIPIKFESLVNDFESIIQHLLTHEESLQTVINVKEHQSFDTFFNEHNWFIKYFHTNPIVDDSTSCKCFLVGLSPDRLIIGNVKLVDNFVNLYIVTNNYEIIPSLYNKFCLNQ